MSAPKRRNPTMLRFGTVLLAIVALLLPVALQAPRSVGSAQDATPAASPVATPVGAVEVPLLDAAGVQVGTASLSEAAGGVRLVVEVDGLTPGEHGIHVHE